jgi:hypothetical protein
VIVRIATQGQFKVEDSVVDKLNDIDNQIVDVVAAGDEAGFAALLSSLLNVVTSSGEAVAQDELVASDLILPSPDTTLEEAKLLFAGDGLIPD